MTDYYFSKNPEVDHDLKTWRFRLLGHEMEFTTDNGVFSKQRVDYGSRVLLSCYQDDQYPAGPILDLGCGYGPIGLAVALAYPQRKVDLVDVNERAIELSKRNAEQNNLDNVHVFESDRYQNVTQQYAAILTNPPVRAGKDVVTEMVSGRDHLLPHGKMLVVLQKKQGADSAKKQMKSVFGNVEVLKKDKGYYILQSEKV